METENLTAVPDGAVGKTDPSVIPVFPDLPDGATGGFFLCRHRRKAWVTWYLCDRGTINGKRRHKVIESYGREKPELFRPEIVGGVDRAVLPGRQSGSIDLLYLDPPYGTTAGEWDRAPDWGWLGSEVRRLLKPTGQALLHGTAPMIVEAAHAFYAAGLRHRFDLAWVKTAANGRLRTTSWISDFEPIRAHEWVLTFARADSRTRELTFNLPAMRRRVDGKGKPSARYAPSSHQQQDGWSGSYESKLRPGQGWPTDVIFEEPAHGVDLYAQKPEDLVSHLTLLLTGPGDVVLDPYAGSGTTVRAAWRLGRRAIGIEAQPERYTRLAAEFGGPA